MSKMNSLLLAMTLLGGCKLGDGDLDALQRCYREDGGVPGGCRSLVSQEDLSEAADMTGAPNDLNKTPPDLGMPLEQVPGCATGWGFKVGTRMVACPGPFALGRFYSQCGSGWLQCENLMGDAALCDSLPGYFAGARPVAQQAPFPPSGALQCTWNGSLMNWPRGIAGCGVSAGGATYIAPATMQCGGFPRVQLCSGGWSCPASNPPADSDFSKVTNTNSGDGVLCCQ